MGKLSWDFFETTWGTLRIIHQREGTVGHLSTVFHFPLAESCAECIGSLPSRLQRKVLGYQRMPSGREGREEERWRCWGWKESIPPVSTLGWARGLWCRASTASGMLWCQKSGALDAYNIPKESNSRKCFFLKNLNWSLGSASDWLNLFHMTFPEPITVTVEMECPFTLGGDPDVCGKGCRE